MLYHSKAPSTYHDPLCVFMANLCKICPIQGRRKQIKVGWDNLKICFTANEKSDEVQTLPRKTIYNNKKKQNFHLGRVPCSCAALIKSFNYDQFSVLISLNLFMWSAQKAIMDLNKKSVRRKKTPGA